MAVRKNKAEKALDARIARIYGARCNGVTINIMDIPKIYAAARVVAANGADDAELGDYLAAYVNAIRVK
jgi:hypothetical protein